MARGSGENWDCRGTYYARPRWSRGTYYSTQVIGHIIVYTFEVIAVEIELFDADKPTIQFLSQ